MQKYNFKLIFCKNMYTLPIFIFSNIEVIELLKNKK